MYLQNLFEHVFFSEYAVIYLEIESKNKDNPYFIDKKNKNNIYFIDYDLQPKKLNFAEHQDRIFLPLFVRPNDKDLNKLILNLFKFANLKQISIKKIKNNDIGFICVKEDKIGVYLIAPPKKTYK